MTNQQTGNTGSSRTLWSGLWGLIAKQTRWDGDLLSLLFLYLDKMTFGYCESRWPLCPQDVKADIPIAVDVWVVDSGCKGNLAKPIFSLFFFYFEIYKMSSSQLFIIQYYLWWFEWIVSRKMDIQRENPTLIRTVHLKKSWVFVELIMPVFAQWIQVIRPATCRN